MPSTDPRPRLRALLAAAGLTAGVILAPTAVGTVEAVEPPTFSVQSPHQVWGHGDGWPLGATVDMTVTTTDEPPVTLFTADPTTVGSWGPELWQRGFDYNLAGVFDIEPGQRVMITAEYDDTNPGPEVTKDLVVDQLTVVVDETSLEVRGTSAAPDDAEVRVSVEPAWRQTFVAGGTWTAALGADPPLDQGEGVLNVFGGNTGWSVEVVDDDGDTTHQGGSVPYIHVSPYGDHAFGDNWAPNRDVDVTIDGTPLDPAPTADENGHLEFDLAVDPVASVVATQDLWIAQVMVSDLQITTVDEPSVGIVSGSAPEGALVDVHAFLPGDGFASRVVTAGAGGFTVDFSVPGGPDDWGPDSATLEPGTLLRAHIYNDRQLPDHDATHHDYCIGECGEPGGGGPFNFFEEGDVLISQTSGTLWVWGTEANELIGEYQLPFGGTWDIQYRDAGHLLIANSTEGRVMELDLATGDVYPIVELGPPFFPIGIAYDETTETLFIAESDEEGGVFRFDLPDGPLVEIHDQSADGIAYGPDGYVYFGGLSRIRPDGTEVAPVVDLGVLGYTPNGFVFTPEGMILMTSMFPAAVLEIDPDTGAHTVLYEGTDMRSPEDVALAPDFETSGDIYVIDSGYVDPDPDDELPGDFGIDSGLYLLDGETGALSELHRSDPLGDTVDLLIALQPPPPERGIHASLTADNIAGPGWPLQTGPVEITIDDDELGVLGPFTIDLGGEQEDSFNVESDQIGNVDLTPGDVITVTETNGDATKTLTLVGPLTATLSPDTTSATGERPSGQPVSVFATGESCGEVWVDLPPGDATWSVDYGDPSLCGDQGLGPNAWVQVYVWDDDGDATLAESPQPGPEPELPWFVVRTTSQVVQGERWPEGAAVTLTIDDPGTAGAPDYSATRTAEPAEWDPNQTIVDFWPFEEIGLEVLDGFELVMSDGESTKTHTVRTPVITDIDLAGDTVSGTATPDSSVHVHIHETDVSRDTPTGADGAWTADFSVPGPEGQEETLDIDLGTAGEVFDHDDDGDATQVDWRVPNPVFFVYPDFSSIGGHDWTEGAQASVTIDDPDTPESPDIELSAPIERFGPWEPPRFDVGIDGEEFTIEPGHVVTVTDGTTTKTHTVTPLEMSGASTESDTVSGIADVGAEIVVFVHHEEGGAQRHVSADQDGNWTADFTIAGPDEAPFDLQAGMAVEAHEPDDDEDATAIRWELLVPRLTADQFDDIVRLDWPDSGVEFDVRISALGDGPDWTTTATTHPIGESPWEIGLFLDLYPDRDIVTGTTIELLQPGTLDVIRSLEVSPLTVTQLDPDDDDGSVRGIATGGSTLQIDMGNSTGWAWRVVEVGQSGDWIAYPGRDPVETGEEGDGIVDDVGWRFEVGFNVEEPDEDGDATVVRWENYRMGAVSVLSGRDIVVGERWTGLWPATLTIENESGQIVHFEDGVELDRGPSALTIDGEALFWDSPEWQDHFSRQVPAGTAEPGYTVTISDRLYTESTVISEVRVTEVDLANDVIRGTSDGDELVLVFAEALEPGEPFFSSVRFTCSDAAGDWEVGFGEPLVGPLEFPCLPPEAQQPLVDGEEIPPFDLDHTTVARGFASTTDSHNPFGNEPDDDDGTIVTWWTHLTGLDATPALAEVDVDTVTFSATVAGPDPENPARHAVSATVDWGEGQPDVLDESALTPNGDGDIVLTVPNIYAAPGVYTVYLTVAFEDGHVEIEAYSFVVVFDPNGGFVTGGGWINSPAGAYGPDPTLTGPAHFGFVSKYKQGKSTPDGNANFQFQTADLHFQSTAFEWLVITGGDHAKFKGVGTINGAGDYGFMITAVDDPDGDTFRIKIWDRASGDTVYDNKLGGDDDGTPLGGGSIIVHTAKKK